MEPIHLLMQSVVRRRLFYASGGAALVALFAVRYFVIPYYAGTAVLPTPDILGSVIDALLVTLVASLSVTVLLQWLSAPETEPATIKVIEPREIAETLEAALSNSAEWWYRGHTGRHLRSVTLPKLASAARSRNRTIAVYLQILDPSHPETCEYYADYRRRLRTATRDLPWTAERVSKELFATILSAYVWKEQEPALEISVALHHTVSLFRVDLSSRLAIITKEDPKEPALRFDAGTFFYTSYREDLRMTRNQAPVLERARIASFGQLTVESVRAFFIRLGLLRDGTPDEFLQDVIDLARRGENPYE